MLKKVISISFVVILFIFSVFFYIVQNKVYRVTEVVSPTEFVLDGKVFVFTDLDCFDDKFTEHNKQLSQRLNITETEAFIAGNLAKYWAKNVMLGRYVYIKNDFDLIYLRHSYRNKFLYSGFCLQNSKPFYRHGFESKINDIRNSKYKIYDLENNTFYEIDNQKIKELKNFVIIKKYQLHSAAKILNPQSEFDNHAIVADFGDIKLVLADFTKKLKPDRKCSSAVCKEILSNINSAQDTIDLAIYGYSQTDEIEKALQNATKRGVKIRLVYDTDKYGKNIYPDTNIITKLISDNRNDFNSKEVNSIMHNKFYIFDNKTVITGSANLSHTDMSGYNSNSILVINSKEIAQIYKQEFEQMYAGYFHLQKKKQVKNQINLSGNVISVYFSPQDKVSTNKIVPMINNARKYIYIPTFVLTDREITNALVKANQRGVDVRIIMDALNASVKHSKHSELRNYGVMVKTENYAGKMHSKSMVIDDEYVIVGSMNFSYSGENRNDENLVIVKNSQMAKFYKNFFLYQWDKIDNKWLTKTARAEGKDSIGSCSDGLDNNYDGRTDKDDIACQ